MLFWWHTPDSIYMFYRNTWVSWYKYSRRGLKQCRKACICHLNHCCTAAFDDIRAVHLPGSTTFEMTVQFGWGEAELQPKCKAQMIHSEKHVRVDPIIPVRFLLNTTNIGAHLKSNYDHHFFFFKTKIFFCMQ